MGDVCGTNTSFSRAINACNLCEDLDQRKEKHAVPCGFLREETCRFTLRTPERDNVILYDPECPPSAAQMQAFGVTTLIHGLYDIPGIYVSRPGPKDPMHSWNEGRTGQLGAVTCWNFVKSGFATAAELQQRATEFDWTPTSGGSKGGYYVPNYLPDKIFVSTKVVQADGSWVWGPHKNIAIPGSAKGVCTFALMSTEFFRPFIPVGKPLPEWLLAWQLHVAAFSMVLRFKFTFRELLHLEDIVVRSESLIISIPEYYALWIPKAHWILHAAHDIYR